MTLAVDPTAVDVALRDGSTVHVRPVRESDQEALRALLGRLSPESRWLRFFSAGANLDAMARWGATRAKGRGYGVVATVGERIVGHAAYVRMGSDRAEVAFEVDEDHQGLGIATVLLAHLAEGAKRRGSRRSWPPCTRPTPHGPGLPRLRLRGRGERRARPAEFEFPASLDADALAAFEDRDRMAAVAAVTHVLRPRSVAVIGASRRPGTVGAAVLENLHRRWLRGPAARHPPEAERSPGCPCTGRSPRRPGRSSWPSSPCRRGRPAGRARLRGRGRAGARRALGGVRRGGRRRRAPAGRAAGGLPRRRDAARRTELPRRPGHPHRPQRDLRARAAPARPDRLRVAERRLRDRGDRRDRAPRPRAVVVRLHRQQGRPVRQRLPALLGAGRRHRRAPALPRVLREPAPLRPDRAQRRRAQADRGRQERTLGGRRARRRLAHRRAAGRLRRDRRRAVRPRGRDPHRHRRRAVRRRGAAGRPAAAARSAGRDRDQRRRPGHRVRRCLRSRRAARRAAPRARATGSCAGSCPATPRSRTPST